MYSHDKTFSKCNLFYTLHLVPKCHKCSIVGPFMVHDNFKFRKLCCRVAELGSLSSGAKMAMKIFVKRIYNFCDKCVVFARNRKFANSTQ